MIIRIQQLQKFHKELHDLFTQVATSLPSSDRRNEILDHLQSAMKIIEDLTQLERVRVN